MGLPVYLNAQEMSDDLKRHNVEVSAARLTELADADYIPHYRCDLRGAPLFRRQEIRDWVEENLIMRRRPRRFPNHIAVYDSRTNQAVTGTVPHPLVPFAHHLNEFGLFVLQITRSVYFLINDDEVVYIGETTNLAARLLQHITRMEFDRVFYLRVPPEDACSIEKAFILHFKPKHNTIPPWGCKVNPAISGRFFDAIEGTQPTGT